MTTLVANGEVEFFSNGPAYRYDEVYSCFPGNSNGLLFRLVDKEKNRWYFYNDTMDMIMKVRATFKPGSNIKALRGTRTLTRERTGDGDTVIEVDVNPCFTSLFIEGDPVSFELDFQSEAAPEDKDSVVFLTRKPRAAYSKIYKCFRNNGNGLLFRLVDEHNNKWYFHNDTHEFIMTAVVDFGDRDTVKPLGKTEEIGVPDDSPNGVTYRLWIPPAETMPFIEGKPVNYRLSFSADPISNDKPLDPSELEYQHGGPDVSVCGHQPLVYKCFKKHGNGLLFRLVDAQQRTWSFYNDTEEYVMKATVHFPNDEDFLPSHDAMAIPDPDEADTTVVTIDVPPLTTLKFIDGLPTVFEMSYSAESVHKSKPESNPVYKGSGPDTSVMEYTSVFKCVKALDSNFGVLYRLEDTKRKRWGFYNDTENVTFTARVTFTLDSQIIPLGGTLIESNPEGKGNVYIVTIEPHMTVLFIEGIYDGYESSYTGVLHKKDTSE